MYDLPPPLLTIPVLKTQNEQDHCGRASARDTARRQRALDEVILRGQENPEAAEDRHLAREAEQIRRSFAPVPSLPDSQNLPSENLERERASRSRHTSPHAPPSSPNRSQHMHRPRSHGHATVHRYHYLDSPPKSSRPPSDIIRERGREVIERERARAADNYRLSAIADDTRSNGNRSVARLQ